MTVSEEERFEMHLGLRRALGDEVANAVMEHLPNGGWGDVARVRDIDLVRSEIRSVSNDVRRLDNTLKLLIGGVLTVSAALLVMFVQLSQAIAGL